MMGEDLQKVKTHSGRSLSQVRFMHGLQAQGGHSALAKRRELLLALRTQGIRDSKSQACSPSVLDAYLIVPLFL